MNPKVRKDCICINCGKQFYPQKIMSGKYCSNKCQLDYYQKQLRQEAWEKAHHSTFDDELLEHYGIYYDVTEDILDSLNNIYHWRDSCKDERYYQTKDVINEYWNCCHE